MKATRESITLHRLTLFLLLATLTVAVPAAAAAQQAEAPEAGAMEPGMHHPEMKGHHGECGRCAGDAPCKEKAAKHEEMMAKHKEAKERLDQLVAEMNAASGDAKVDAMAAVIQELLAQREMMHRHVKALGKGCKGHGAKGHGCKGHPGHHAKGDCSQCGHQGAKCTCAEAGKECPCPHCKGEAADCPCPHQGGKCTCAEAGKECPCPHCKGEAAECPCPHHGMKGEGSPECPMMKKMKEEKGEPGAMAGETQPRG